MKSTRPFAILSAALLLTAQNPAGASAPAGSLIENVATFEDGLGHVVSSSPVQFQVAEVCSPHWSPRSQHFEFTPGAASQIGWALHQSGNGASSLRVTVSSNRRTTVPFTLNGIPATGSTTVTLAPEEQGGSPLDLQVNFSALSGHELFTAEVQCLSGTQLPGGYDQAVADVGTTMLAPEVSKRLADNQPEASSGTLLVGSAVDYIVSAHNPNAAPMTLTLEDVLDSDVELVSASGGAQQETVSGGAQWAGAEAAGGPETQRTRVYWTLDLAPGETFEATVRVKSRPNRADGTPVLNWARGRSEQGGQTLEDISQPVELKIYSGALLLDKQSAGSGVYESGQRVEYFITVVNPSTLTIRNVRISDAPDRQLTLIRGGISFENRKVDSTLTVGAEGERANTLTEVGGQLLSEAFDLAPGQSATLRYAMRLPLSSGEINNTARAKGKAGQIEVESEVESNQGNSTVRVSEAASLGYADVAGRVYVDSNRNGRYDRGESPLKLARVILAGGQEALTDREGRFSFLSLPTGSQTLLLDPSSVSGRPARTWQGAGLSGAAHIQLNAGITTVDFPVYQTYSAATLSRLVDGWRLEQSPDGWRTSAGCQVTVHRLQQVWKDGEPILEIRDSFPLTEQWSPAPLNWNDPLRASGSCSTIPLAPVPARPPTE